MVRRHGNRPRNCASLGSGIRQGDRSGQSRVSVQGLGNESSAAHGTEKRYHRRTHKKCGIRIPKTVREALQLDATNGNNLWQEAIRKEMDLVSIAFKVLLVSDDDKVPPAYQEITCHVTFYVKMENFRRKAPRYVAGGRKTDGYPATTLTYAASVVSRESVRIALTTMAALHDLEVKVAGDIHCAAYFNSTSIRKDLDSSVWPRVWK